MNPKSIKIFLALCLGILLYACGGGGGSENNSKPKEGTSLSQNEADGIFLQLQNSICETANRCDSSISRQDCATATQADDFTDLWSEFGLVGQMRYDPASRVNCRQPVNAREIKEGLRRGTFVRNREAYERCFQDLRGICAQGQRPIDPSRNLEEVVPGTCRRAFSRSGSDNNSSQNPTSSGRPDSSSEGGPGCTTENPAPNPTFGGQQGPNNPEVEVPGEPGGTMEAAPHPQESSPEEAEVEETVAAPILQAAVDALHLFTRPQVI